MNKFFHPIERLRALEQMRHEAFGEQVELDNQEREARSRVRTHQQNTVVLTNEIYNLRTLIGQQGGLLMAQLQEYDGVVTQSKVAEAPQVPVIEHEAAVEVPLPQKRRLPQVKAKWDGEVLR